MSRENDASSVLVRRAERVISQLENGAGRPDDGCAAHGVLAEGVVLMLQILVEMLKAEEPAGSGWVPEWLKRSPLSVLAGTLPPSALVFLYLVGKGNGWW